MCDEGNEAQSDGGWSSRENILDTTAIKSSTYLDNNLRAAIVDADSGERVREGEAGE